jgi:hypothetical protein
MTLYWYTNPWGLHHLGANLRLVREGLIFSNPNGDPDRDLLI